MARLIDSSVVVSLERRERQLDDLFSTWGSEEVAVASVTISELLVGVHLAVPGRRRERRQNFVEQITERILVLPFDLTCARFHAQIVAQLQEQVQPIRLNDTLIAAIALANGYSEVTDNVKHFVRVAGLAVERPSWLE